jgi:predicted  nucleic acid-binding Zn-ribbon protein
MNIGIEFVVSMITTAAGIGVAYATFKTKIDHLEKSNDQYAMKDYVLQLHKESTYEQKQLADRITHKQGIYIDMQKDLSSLREDHGTRIVRLEEAMLSINRSIASIDAKLDRLLLK